MSKPWFSDKKHQWVEWPLESSHCRSVFHMRIFQFYSRCNLPNSKCQHNNYISIGWDNLGLKMSSNETSSSRPSLIFSYTGDSKLALIVTHHPISFTLGGSSFFIQTVSEEHHSICDMADSPGFPEIGLEKRLYMHTIYLNISAHPFHWRVYVHT